MLTRRRITRGSQKSAELRRDRLFDTSGLLRLIAEVHVRPLANTPKGYFGPSGTGLLALAVELLRAYGGLNKAFKEEST